MLGHLPAPFVHVGPMTFFRDQDSITWSMLIRSAIGLAADMSLITWALGYISAAFIDYTIVFFALTTLILSTAGFLYLLLLKEFLGLVYSYRKSWQRFTAGTAATMIVLFTGLPPAYYGIEALKGHAATLYPPAQTIMQKEGSR